MTFRFVQGTNPLGQFVNVLVRDADRDRIVSALAGPRTVTLARMQN